MMARAIAVLALCLGLFSAGAAYATGYHAIAYDQRNVVVGFAKDAPSASAARDGAAAECQRDGGASCRVIWADQGGGCVAIATTASGSFTLEAGSALDRVERVAMRECGGFADGGSCQLEVSFCSN